MFHYSTLERLCKPVVLRRAQRLAQGGESLYRRRCRFDEGETVLRARVDSQASWDEAHRTMVALDELSDDIVYYECDCRTMRAAEGPCDHVAAVVLDFLADPNRYEGYDARDRITTSRGIARFMEDALAASVPPAVENPTELEAHTVRLEATLSYEVGFDVRFRLVGSKGAYTLKALTAFAQNVEASEFASYGKRLAFEHVERSFTPQAWGVAVFLVRALQNRRSYALERAGSRHMVASTVQPTRELHLSAPELWELLELYKDEGIAFEDRLLAADAGPRQMRVVDKDPSLRIEVRDLAQEGGFELERYGAPRIVRAGSRALAWDNEALYRCTDTITRNVALLQTLLQNPAERLVVSNEDAPVFCASVLSKLEGCADVRTCERLESLRPRPCRLQFYLDYDARQRLVCCDARASYGDVAIPLVEAHSRTGDAASQGVVRDTAAEARGREVLRRYFALREGGAVSSARGEDLGVLLYEGVAALREVGEVFAFPAFARLVNHARPRVRVGLSVHARLLELGMQLEGLPEAELAGLLESYRRKRRYCQLTDGSVLRLADADLLAAARVADELDMDSSRFAQPVTLPAYAACMLGPLLDDESASESVERYLASVRAQDLDAYEAPAELAGILRPYQLDGYRWLCGLSALGLGGILADEMGLGKTLQLIAFLLARSGEARRVGPSLVVCPSSLVYNWQAEFAKFAPGLTACVVAGLPEERAALRARTDVDVFVTSYDLLRRDSAEYEGEKLWCVALDEAQYIKNPTTQAAQCVKRLDAVQRVALTGTPVENRLSELWSIFDFLMPGLLGSYGHFREKYERPIVEDEDASAIERLREVLRPFILRRTKRDVARDLPDKIEQIVRIHLSDEQRRLYAAQVQEVRAEVEAEDSARGNRRFQILALLTRLRQICCDPALLYEDYTAPSAKSEAILTLAEQVVDAGEKALVFSQFTSYLHALSEELENKGIRHYVIEGSTPSARRLELVNAFNADDTPVFLISLKAGGTGLNLTGATVVVHADPWWNVAAQNQATDRAHRIGQTREVTVYKVIASDTIEERILELQHTKAELAEAVVQGDASGVSLAALTREDLEELLA